MNTTTTTPKNQALKREDYKLVKRMNREEMTAYLARIYRRGFEEGVKSATAKVEPPKAVEK